MKKSNMLIIFLFITASLWFLSCSKNSKIPSDAVELIKLSGYNSKDFLKGPYSRFCTENKELAYYYLKVKLGRRDLPCVLHKVKNGENFWGIAKSYGVDIDTIIAANPDLKKLLAYAGQLIIIPGVKGVLHEIKNKKEIRELAELYEIEADKIINFNPKIGENCVVFVPGAKPKKLNPEMAVYYEKRALFRSPICGNGYSSLVGMRKHPIVLGVTKFHNGVDIRAKKGTWVGAAAEGTVIYAGWINGYGNTIKIRHENGYETLYAHLSEINVKTGQKVFSGKLIGKSGNTGHSTGPHLHFSVFQNGKTMNPLDYIW